MKRGLVAIVFLMLLFGVGFVRAIELTINDASPEENYNSRFLTVGLANGDEKSDFFYLKEESWILLYKNNLTCTKKLTFSEGENSLTVKAVNRDGKVDNETISFFVDSKKPRILSTSPRSGSFFNGNEFSVKYTEENLGTVTLFYGSNIDEINHEPETLVKTDSDCESGKNKVCDFTNVNLSAYDGQTIWYWFDITDIVGNSEVSKKQKVKVDTTAPVVLSHSIVPNGKRVSFVFDIQELNFKEIDVMDKADFKGFNLLCSSLRNGRCSITNPFASGKHWLDFVITDKAGNSYELDKDNCNDCEFTIPA